MRFDAVTFDIWDTLILDGSDEPKRRARGLPPKDQARRDLVFRALDGRVERPVLDAAWAVVGEAFRRIWKELFVTWPVRKRMEILLAGLGEELPEERLADLVRTQEIMELEVGVDPVPGAAEALAALAERYPLAVISDTIFTPGWALREILEGLGLARYFQAMIFSDEVGHSKPHPEVFLAAAEALGTRPERVVHVGDRPRNDVAGIRALGGRAVLFTGVADRAEPGLEPDAVCADLRELPAVLEALAQGREV